MTSLSKISIIIPVYRSASMLDELVSRIVAVMMEVGCDYEIILVDDASPDDSWEVMRKLRADNPCVKIIQHMRNFGQHRAILCGMRYVGGDLVVTMDDDLQHPPEEIPKLIDSIRNDDEVDVVIGAYETKQHSWFRNLGSRAVNRVTSYVFDIDPRLRLTSFRIMRRCIVEELVNARSCSPRVDQLLMSITHRIKNTPVAHQAREHGRSGYSFGRLVGDALDNILNNSSLPLQIVSYLGFGSALLSFLLTLWYLYKFFFVGIAVAGWTTIVLLLLFFCGALLFSLGIVGEYLIRILREVQGKPSSVVRKIEL